MSDEFQEIDTSMARLGLDQDGGQPGAPPSRQETVFDDQGDLRLEIGQDCHTFVVDSRALSRASRSWNLRLRGEWSKSKPAIQLPDDDAQAMSVLLGIVHGDFPREPSEFLPQELCLITAAAKKYDLTHLLRPWARMWIDGLKQGMDRDLDFQSYVRRLCIAWDLGDDDLFGLLVKKVVMEVEIDDKGALLDPDGTPLTDQPLVALLDISDDLSKHRTGLIEIILRHVDEVLQQYLEGQAPRCLGLRGMTSASGDKTSSDCSMVLLGSLMRELVEVYLFPIPESSDIFESVESLKAKVRGLLTRIQPLGVDSIHESCNPFPAIADRIDDEVEARLHSIVLAPSYCSHLDTQAHKSGCGNPRRFFMAKPKSRTGSPRFIGDGEIL